jgi:hypothetical protein
VRARGGEVARGGGGLGNDGGGSRTSRHCRGGASVGACAGGGTSGA